MLYVSPRSPLFARSSLQEGSFLVTIGASVSSTMPMDRSGEDRLSHVLTASERLVTARSMDEVVAVLRDTARTAVGAEGVAVVLSDDGRCSYVAEDAVSPLWQGQTFPADQCISGWVMRHGETVAIRDVRLDPRIPQEAYASAFVRSLVMVPIGRPDSVAALGAYWSDVRTHDRDTIERLESLARLATIAIENARLTQARDRAAALGAAQNRILALAVEETTLTVALEAIVREVEALSSSGLLGSILLLDEDGRHLRHGAGSSLPAAYNEAIDGIPIGPNVGSCGTAAFRNEPVFASDITNDPLWTQFRELALRHGLRASLLRIAVSARARCTTSPTVRTTKSTISRSAGDGSRGSW
jgi:GAF domain-containing protein